MLGRTVDRGNHVAQYTKDGILISTYKSYAEAERVTSVSNTGIRSCCKGERKTAGGYIWVKIDQHG